MKFFLVNFAFAQEFGGKDEIVRAHCLSDIEDATHMQGVFDDNARLRGDGNDIFVDRLDRLGVERVVFGL